MKSFTLLSFALFIYIVPLSVLSQKDTLSLEELYLTALENNFGIRIARNNATIAENNNTLGNAGILPQLNLSGSGNTSVNNTRLQFFSGDTREADNARNRSVNGLAELNWTVFDGLRMFAAQDRLVELERIGQLELRAQAETMYLQLASLYFRLMQEQRLEQVLQTSIEISKTRLGHALRRFDIGSGSELDLNQAKIDLSSDSTLLLRQKVIIENLTTDISFLTGQLPDYRFAAGSGLELRQDLTYENLRLNIEIQNINLLLARTENSIAERQVREARSFTMPTANLYANYTGAQSRADVGILQSNRSYGFGYGFRLSYNLFDGFNVKREIQNSKILLASSEIFTESVLLESRTQLLKSYTSWEYALKEVELEKQNLSITRKNMQIAVEMYRLGAINEIDFREIQLRALEAENRLLTAEYLAKIAEMNMLYVSGNLPI